MNMLLSYNIFMWKVHWILKKLSFLVSQLCFDPSVLSSSKVNEICVTFFKMTINIVIIIIS
jgi:hypothetical protein